MNACTNARTCILYNSGIRIPSLTPRNPSIGLASCILWTAENIAVSRGEISKPSASDLARSAVSTDKGGKNSCKGGSSKRTVTGNPDMAIMIPTKSALCSGSISAITLF